jgi:hypothetical protein
MNKRLLTLLLLLVMGFNIAHAYVIEVFDTHPCSMSEYVHDINDVLQNDMTESDICHIDHFFHIAFILPELEISLSRSNFAHLPFSNIQRYEYNSYDNFLKPPINA